jgi:hypothetical protein
VTAAELPDETGDHPGSRLLLILLFFSGVAVLLVALILGYEQDLQAPNLPPWFRQDDDRLSYSRLTVLMGTVFGCTALGVLAWGLIRNRPSLRLRWRPYVLPMLLVLCTVSCAVFFYAARGMAMKQYVSAHDSMHYLLGAKYFPELGYYGLYECIVVVDQQGRKVLEPRRVIRDLRTYKFVRVRHVIGAAEQRCAAAFSAERWAQFRADVEQYQGYLDKNSFLVAVGDHGYNGTPLHTLVAGGIARMLGAVSYRKLVQASLIDMLGLMAMFAAITVAYGWRWGLLFAIFFTTDFADRFYLIGGSFLRYWWMIPLGLGIAALHKGRHTLAGTLITLAGLLNVFPILFSVGVGVRMLDGMVRERHLSAQHRRYLLASIITAAVGLLLGAAHGQLFDNYTGFLDNMAGHKDIVTNARVGFRYLFLIRGDDLTGSPLYPIALKTEELAQLMPLIWACVALLLAICAWIVRPLRDVEAAILMGITSFYLLFGTVAYYFAVYALLVLVWAGHLADWRAYVLFTATWLMIAVPYGAWLFSHNATLAYNTVFSAMIGLVLAATFAYFARANARRI